MSISSHTVVITWKLYLPIVFLANLPWLVFPIYIIYRMWRYPHPFTREQPATEQQTPQVAREQSSTGSIVGGEVG